jgi:hypothetical protein
VLARYFSNIKPPNTWSLFFVDLHVKSLARLCDVVSLYTDQPFCLEHWQICAIVLIPIIGTSSYVNLNFIDSCFISTVSVAAFHVIHSLSSDSVMKGLTSPKLQLPLVDQILNRVVETRLIWGQMA